MQREMRARLMVCVALVASGLAPAAAQAQYSSPAPNPGFRYIFDGSATGSDASFDKWAFAAGTAAQSRPAPRAARARRP